MIMYTVILFRPDVYDTYSDDIAASSQVGNFKITPQLGGRWQLATAIPLEALQSYIDAGKIYQPSLPDPEESLAAYQDRMRSEILQEFQNLGTGVRDAMIMNMQQFKVLRRTPEWKALEPKVEL